VLPALLYGKGHPYGNPFTGTGTEESVSKLAVGDMKRYHEIWFKPNNATLVIVGDTSLADIAPRLERLFKDWKPGDVPEKKLEQVALSPRNAVYLIDRPGSEQSVIFAGQVAPPKANPQEIAIETMSFILGGNFTSRLNLNLREDKHWSYGVRMRIVDARGQRPFYCRAPVQGDKTKEAMQEIAQELQGMISSKPPTEAELQRPSPTRPLVWPARGRPSSWSPIASATSSASACLTITSKPTPISCAGCASRIWSRLPKLSSTRRDWSGSWWATAQKSSRGSGN